MNSNLVFTQSPASAVTEVEAASPVQALCEHYTRLGTTYELAGELAAAATCESIAYRLLSVVDEIRELHALDISAL